MIPRALHEAPRDRLRRLRANGVLGLEEYLTELEQLEQLEPPAAIEAGDASEDASGAASAVAAADDEEDDDDELVDEYGMPFDTPPGKRPRAHSPQTTAVQSGYKDGDVDGASSGGDSNVRQSRVPR